jgi:serine/threonine protein phosphatase PrpC
MDAKYFHFSVHKLGNDFKDYEDAYSPKLSGNIDIDYFVCAISDGASESSFASEWAKMLTRAYVKSPFKNVDSTKKTIEVLAKHWHKIVYRLPLPWFAEEKVRLGAFASFLGLELSSSQTNERSDYNWSAIASGDSCLFQVRNNQLIDSFPILSSKEFNNSPVLISSNLIKNVLVWEKIQLKQGTWEKGDIFILMTDAIANWFLVQYELNERPWEIIHGFIDNQNRHELFENWINNLRSLSQLKNDDVTILFIKL